MHNAVRLLTKEDKEANHPYRAGALVSLPTINQIPQEYLADLSLIPVINQAVVEHDNDECGGCSLAVASGVQEGIPLDPHFHWMMARQRANMTLNEYGVSNRDLAMTAVKVGSLLKRESPMDFIDGRNRIADPTNWDIAGLIRKAVYQKKGSVVWVEAGQGYDAFDYYRASVTKFNALYKKPHCAVFGLMWNYPMHEYQFEVPFEQGVGHDVTLVGWDRDYAIIRQSYGTEVGKNGEQRLHRSIINRWAEDFGCFITIDATQEEIKYAVETGTKLDNNWLANILVAFANALKDLLAKLKAKTYGIFTR